MPISPTKIRRAVMPDAEEIRALIVHSVMPETNPDFDQQGIEAFYKPNNLSAIQKRILDPDYLTLCFLKEDKIVGLIAVYKQAKIDQLFIAPAYQRRGIARQLWDEAKVISVPKNNEGRFWVKSSRVAVKTYMSFGFLPTGEVQRINGIYFVPMEMKI